MSALCPPLETGKLNPKAWAPGFKSKRCCKETARGHTYVQNSRAVRSRLCYCEGTSWTVHFLADLLHHVVEIFNHLLVSIVDVVALLFEVLIAFWTAPSLSHLASSPCNWVRALALYLCICCRSSVSRWKSAMFSRRYCAMIELTRYTSWSRGHRDWTTLFWEVLSASWSTLSLVSFAWHTGVVIDLRGEHVDWWVGHLEGMGTFIFTALELRKALTLIRQGKVSPQSWTYVACVCWFLRQLSGVTKLALFRYYLDLAPNQGTTMMRADCMCLSQCLLTTPNELYTRGVRREFF